MKSGSLLFMLLLLCPQPALAQADTTPGNVLPVEKGGTPRSAILRLNGSSFSEGAPKLVIGNLVDGRGGVQLYFQPGAGPDQNLTDTLAAESVQKMIELSPEQQKEFREIRRRLAKMQQELSQKYEHRNDISIIQPLREQINRKYEQERVALSTEIDQQLQEKLVPRQLRLIGQYRFNQSVRIFGFSKTLSRQHLVDSIGTTEKQVRELEKIRKEAEEEIRKKVAEIRQRARQKMLRELGENQRKKVREFEGAAGIPHPPDFKQQGSSRKSVLDRFFPAGRPSGVRVESRVHRKADVFTGSAGPVVACVHHFLFH